MELFLRTLVKLSLLGSALAVVLTVLRPLLRRWVSRKSAYYLWLLVLLRLCVPVGFDLPVPAAAEEPSSAPVPPAMAQAVSDLPVYVPDAGPAADGLPDIPEPAIQPDISTDVPVQPETTPSARRQSEWLKNPYLWGALWWFGMLASAGWFVLGYLRVSGTVRRTAGAASPEALAILRELDPKGRVRMVESPAVNTPLLLGAVRPVIVLPFGVTDAARLRDILAHELTHVRRHDLLFKWFAAVVTSLHWFNPVMPLVRREIGRACELACDEAVVRGLDSQGRRHYGETLLLLAAHTPGGLGPMAVTLCEERKQLKERLLCIAKYKKSGPLVLFLSLVLAAVMGACAMVTGVKPVTPDAPEPPQEEQTPEEEQTLLEDVTLYELSGGLTIAFPDDIVDQLIIKPGDKSRQGDARFLLAVYEKKSYEDTLADWDYEGGGYLFGIDRYTQARYEEYLTEDGSGISPFATDGIYYYMYTFATDVQFYRSDIENYAEADSTIWQRLGEQVDGILDDFITRNDLESFRPLHLMAADIYQHIIDPQGSKQYDFTARVEHNGKTDEFHITPDNGYNVAFVGNYFFTYTWQEAEKADWLALEKPGTVLTLLSADGLSSIRCRSGDDLVEMVQDGETRYVRAWNPEMPKDPDPHMWWTLWSFMMIIPDDAFNSWVWADTVDGNLSPAEAAQQLAEQVAENFRSTPEWLAWKPLDFQVESTNVIDIYYGEDDPNFCFWVSYVLLLDDPNYSRWQAGAGLGDPIAEGPFAGYYSWSREVRAAKNEDGDWYMADWGTGGYSVNLPGWSSSASEENSLNNATLEELADMFFLTEGWTHDYLLPIKICERPQEELADLNDLLDRHTRTEAQELCRALAAYLQIGYSVHDGAMITSIDDLNALLSSAYRAYTADVPPLY